MKTHHKLKKTIASVTIISTLAFGYNLRIIEGSDWSMVTGRNNTTSGTPVITNNGGTTSDANAGGTVSSGISMTLIEPPTVSAADMKTVGCSPVVWNQMVNDYKRAGSANLRVGGEFVKAQVQGAPNPAAACFDQAASTINSAMSAYNSIMSVLTGGGLDPSKLYAYAQKLVVGAACNQVNSYVAQSGLNTSINGGINSVNSGVGTALNSGTTIGGVNTGSVSSALNGGGFQNGTTTVPYVNNQTVPGSSTIGDYLNNMNPFK